MTGATALVDAVGAAKPSFNFVVQQIKGSINMIIMMPGHFYQTWINIQHEKKNNGRLNWFVRGSKDSMILS